MKKWLYVDKSQIVFKQDYVHNPPAYREQLKAANVYPLCSYCEKIILHSGKQTNSQQLKFKLDRAAHVLVQQDNNLLDRWLAYFCEVLELEFGSEAVLERLVAIIEDRLSSGGWRQYSFSIEERDAE